MITTNITAAVIKYTVHVFLAAKAYEPVERPSLNENTEFSFPTLFNK